MTAGQRAWIDSPRFAAAREAAAEKGRVVQDAAPRCGAKRRTDGRTCRNFALENGRCRIHGGRVPKGDDWHRVRWPGPDAPVWKVEKKIRELERRNAKRAARIAAMSPEERVRFEKRSRAMQPGTPAERAQRKQDRDMAAWLQHPRPEPPDSPELQAINDDIALLEAMLAELRAPTEQGSQ